MAVLPTASKNLLPQALQVLLATVIHVYTSRLSSKQCLSSDCFLSELISLPQKITLKNAKIAENV